MILVPIIHVKSYFNFGLGERIRVTVDYVHYFADDDALLVGVVNILQMAALLVCLLQIEDLELAAEASRLDVNLSRRRRLTLRRSPLTLRCFSYLCWIIRNFLL